MLNRRIGSQRIGDDDDDDIEVLEDLDCSFISQQSGSGTSSRPRRSRDDIEVVELDLEDSDSDDIQEVGPTQAEQVSLIQKKDEEILLLEDDNIGDVTKFKRKSEGFQQSGESLKKTKVSRHNEVTSGGEIIEVKNKSGKSLFVSKSTLSKVMTETRFKSGVVSPVARLLATSSI